MPAEPLVLVERPLPGGALVTLNRPDAMNALSMGLRAELTALFGRLAAEGDVRVVVLTGRGRAFCAGLDLAELAATPPAGGASPLAVDPAYAVVPALERFPGVVIGAVNGAAVTGGLELALACDLLLASTEARFADTHARVGVIPGWGLSQRLPRLIGGPRAKELSLTGNFIGAAQAEAWGLVNRVVPPAELLPQALALARDLLEVPPAMLRQYKRLIDEGLATTLAEGLRMEAARNLEGNRAFDPGALAGRRAAVQARGRKQRGG